MPTRNVPLILNGFVVNVILADPDVDPMPDGYVVGPPGGDIGDGWNGTAYVKPPAPPLPPPPAPTPWADLGRPVQQSRVNAERDRRLMRFRYTGVDYDFDPVSRNRIETARNSAGWALVAGKTPGDLRWADPNVDFGWIRADNGFTLMDAPTTLAFGNAAAAWEGLHIIAARTLKDMTNIPEDYANDQYWPAG